MEEGEGMDLVRIIGCNELLVMQRGGRSARSRLVRLALSNSALNKCRT